jgi:hypothetical protein
VHREGRVRAEALCARRLPDQVRGAYRRAAWDREQAGASLRMTVRSRVQRMDLGGQVTTR